MLKFWPQDQQFWIFMCFLTLPRKNFGTGPQIRPRSLRCTSFPINDSLMIHYWTLYSMSYWKHSQINQPYTIKWTLRPEVYMNYFHTVPFILHNNLQCKCTVTWWSSSFCTTVVTYKNAKPYADTFPSTTAEKWSMHKLFYNSYYNCPCSLTKCQGLHESNHTINKITEHTFRRSSNYTFNTSQKTVMLHETYYTFLFFFYSLYDVNHDGYITRSEMFAVISAIYDLLGDSRNVADHCPELHVNKIFKVHKLPDQLYITLGMTRIRTLCLWLGFHVYIYDLWTSL